VQAHCTFRKAAAENFGRFIHAPFPGADLLEYSVCVSLYPKTKKPSNECQHKRKIAGNECFK
jgi:hypothetical protein